MESIKVVCVTYAEYDELFRNVFDRFKGPHIELTYYEGYLDNLQSGYKQWLLDDVNVILASGGNYGILSEYAAIPVIDIHIRTEEYVRAIKFANENCQPLILPYYRQVPIGSVEAFQGLSKYPLEALPYDSMEALEKIVIESKGKTLVGGCLANQLARLHGVDAVLLMPDEETLAGALMEAETVARHFLSERRKRSLMEMVLTHTVNGIVTVNFKGIVNYINPAAEKLLSFKHSVMDAHIDDLLPDAKGLRKASPVMRAIVASGASKLVVNWLPFEGDSLEPSGVFIFQNSTDVIDAEHRIRRSMREKGLIAKAEFDNILGKCDCLRSEIKRAKMYAKSDSNVLIYGETGVGKELFAQSIHRFSSRQDGPFVAVNCAAIPNALMESELFGYDEGAFTGAKRGGKVGLFELAHGGTLFLDEIGEIDKSVQARLLRVIQEKQVMRIGGDQVIPVDVRIISATNARLIEMMPNDFREDLFYRLDVLSLNIPPLRARGDDVLDLFQWFLKQHLPLEMAVLQLPESAQWVLNAYEWPGNIRELQSVTERFAIQFIQMGKVTPMGIHEILVSAIGGDKLCKSLLKDLKYNPEEDFNHKQKSKRAAEMLDKAFPGKKEFIAAQLGLSRTTLWRRMNGDMA